MKTACLLLMLASCGSRDEEQQRPAQPSTAPTHAKNVDRPTESMLHIEAGEISAQRSRCKPGTLEDRDDVMPGGNPPSQHYETFWIDREVVSCDDYQRCVDAGRCDEVERFCRDAAVVGVDNAKQFCSWRNARLPSFLEWQRASNLREVLRGAEACVPKLLEKPRCLRSGSSGFSFAFPSLNSVEWTSEMDCMKFEGKAELWSLAIDLIRPSLEIRTYAKHTGEFRCARSNSNGR